MEYYWFIFCKGDLMLERNSDGTYTLPHSKEPPLQTKQWTHIHTLSYPIDGSTLKTFAIDAPVARHEKYEMCPLRQSYNKISRDLYLKAGKCQEILYWDSNTRFCGVCGAPMQQNTEISKRCTECGKEVWPQLAIAIIVLIHRGDEVLLVHARNFKSDFYGLVAGFVETGETLEEAVVREVREETGIEITDIKYFASQPWPYPSGLMVGFNANYVSGDIHLQRSELSAGAWFKRDNLPRIPEKLSIARQLIDAWADKKCQ